MYPVKKGMGPVHIFECPTNRGMLCSVCRRTMRAGDRVFWWGNSFRESEEIHLDCIEESERALLILSSVPE